jgi:hypothetical protein
VTAIACLMNDVLGEFANHYVVMMNNVDLDTFATNASVWLDVEVILNVLQIRLAYLGNAEVHNF